MFCGSCGKEIPDGSEFCSLCGAGQTAGARPPVLGIGGGQPVVSPTAGLIAKAARAEFAGFRLGERFILIGAAVAVVAFFLPWAKMPEEAGQVMSMFGQSGPKTGVSGFGMLKVWGGFILLLVLPILSLVLLYLSKQAPLKKKIVLASFQLWIGSVAGPQLLLTMLLVPLATNVLAAGSWGIGLGYSAILTGALILLSDLGQQAQG